MSIVYNPEAVIAYEGRDYRQSADIQLPNYQLDTHGKETPASVAADPYKVCAYYDVTGVAGDASLHVPLNIESLVTLLTCRRASAIEREIAPLSIIIERRNQRTSDLGSLISSLAKTQAQQEGDDDTGKSFACTSLGFNLLKYFTEEELKNVSLTSGTLYSWASSNAAYGAECKTSRKDGIISAAFTLVQSTIDTLGNDSQTDMARMKNLVSKRDESYNYATELSSKISDERKNTIKNYPG